MDEICLVVANYYQYYCSSSLVVVVNETEAKNNAVM